MFKTPKRIATALFTLLIIVTGGYFSLSQQSTSSKHAPDKTVAKTAEDNQVIRVVDGDTIVVAINHKPQTVRLIGINTPETVKPNSPVECFGPESSKHAKELLTGKIVRLESDPSQDDQDKYHRMLRYVFLDDENVNQSFVRDGFAKEYTYKIPYTYQQQFRSDQKAAKKNKLGMWGACP